jgi:acetyl esterase/lipase
VQQQERPMTTVARCLIGFRFAGLVILTVLSSGGAQAQPQLSFYQATPEEILGAPGTIIRQEPMLLPAPFGAAAFRVLYRSTGPHDEPIAVSGVVVIPSRPAPANGRPIIAWAHPTTGVVPRCAPSLALFVFQQIQGLREMIDRGYVVAATDYPGLGTPQTHPYLVGVSEARAVLDSVRAARTISGAQNRFAVWGHSQGGQAALFTGLIASTYAPDLDLTGVAAAAPATELTTLLGDDINSSGGRNLTAMTLWSWSRVFDAPIDRVVYPMALATVDRLADECIESIYDLILRSRTSAPLAQTFLSMSNFYTAEPWRSLMASNTPGPLPAKVPLLLAQGGADELVRPQVTQDYMKRQCQAGGKVQMLFLPNANHGVIARDAAPSAIDWITDRLAGFAPPSDCNRG